MSYFTTEIWCGRNGTFYYVQSKSRECRNKVKFAFVERSRTMKAPVGLLSDRTVLRSKMEGLCPDKFQFAVLGSSRFWGRRSPTRAPSKSNKCPNAGPEQQRPKAGYHHGDGILPFVLYPPVLSWESVVYSFWFNKSEFIYKGEY